METVFITILDLSEDARIKYCSDSIEDILGYLPNEVTGKSCWDYFHPDEIPFAKVVQGRGISLDKAACLNYCRVKHRDGHWVGCECSFTIVHDVLVATTAIYRRGPKARQRAIAGAGIRRIFSSSPRDPRYHMLSFLSNKFYQEPAAHYPEPRAALFLNRFTRTSTIMFATNGIETILGLKPAEVVGKSFYYCIEENCLQEAVKCIESAKANDSLAYLRFWYRNPLQEDNRAHTDSIGEEEDEDEEGGVPLAHGVRSGSSVSMTDASPPQQALDGVRLTNGHTPSAPEEAVTSLVEASPTRPTFRETFIGSESASDDINDTLGLSAIGVGTAHRSASDQSTDLESDAHDAIFDRAASDGSSSSQTPIEDLAPERIEIEAVVSVTSDGLVVILRRAKPLVPHTIGATEVPYYANGMFASPWAPQPVMPPMQQTTVAAATNFPITKPAESSFMDTIRDIAVFAWSLTGINGSLAQYARGEASQQAQPPDMPIWDPNANIDSHADEKYNGFLPSSYRPNAEAELSPTKKDEDVTSSDDEVLWKRQHTMTSWRRPKRRAHHDAFGTDAHDGIDGGTQAGGRKRATRSHSGSGHGTSSGGGSGSTAGSSSGSS